MSGKPYPKSRQLARGQRRYRRKVASPKQWQAIIVAKIGPCRVCVSANDNGHDLGVIQFHHLIPRSIGGDDVPDNIAPLHTFCHALIECGDDTARRELAESLTDAEYAYIIGKLGEGGIERLFGVGKEAQ